MLQPGSMVGPYEVVAPLGAGGMGEVYLGRDSRLGRRVALKTLPDSLVRSPGRVARLHTEARALAALSHPGIATLFGLEQAADARSVIVMELVDGPSLADRLGEGALPLRHALESAVDIASALEAAHEKGVLHRDLKPSNVRFTASGQTKLLDFGLAKLLVASDDHAPDAPTETTDGTETAAVIGTGPYMSPEQARGERLDRRTDVWSFGCLLYEMLTARRAFPGRTRADTLAAILERTPDWSALPIGTPRALPALLALCLEKDRERRLRDIGDARLQIEAVLRGDPEARPRRRRWSAAVAPALVSIALLAAGAFLQRWLAPPIPAPPPAYRQVTFGRGTVTAARFADGGQTIAYSAAWDGGRSAVYTRRLDARDAPARKVQDGTLIAVAGGEMAVILPSGTLARIPLAGGSAREIAREIAAADWGGGEDFAIVRWAEGRAQLEWPIGRVVYRAPGVGGLFSPRLSSARNAVAMLEAAQAPFFTRVVRLDRPGRSRALSRSGLVARGLAWSPDDREIWFNGGDSHWAGEIRAVSSDDDERVVARTPGSLRLFDTQPNRRMLAARETYRAEAWGQLAGDAAPRDLTWSQETWVAAIGADGGSFLIQHTASLDGTSYLARTGAEPIRLGEGAATDLSPDGALAVHLTSDSRMTLVPCRAGEPRRVATPGLKEVHTVKFLPDGRGLLLQASEGEGGLRIYVMDSPGAPPRPVTPEGVAGLELASGPVTPDGRLVAALDYRTGGSALYPLHGGPPQPIPGLAGGEVAVQWQPDGRHLFVQERNDDRAGLSVSIARLDTHTGARRPWLRFDLPDPAGVSHLAAVRITPDGRHWTASYFRTLSDLYVVEGVR